MVEESKRGPPQRPLMCCAMHGWEGVAARLLDAEAPTASWHKDILTALSVCFPLLRLKIFLLGYFLAKPGQCTPAGRRRGPLRCTMPPSTARPKIGPAEAAWWQPLAGGNELATVGRICRPAAAGCIRRGPEMQVAVGEVAAPGTLRPADGSTHRKEP